MRDYLSFVEYLKDSFNFLVGKVGFFGVLRCWRGAIVGCNDHFLFVWCGWSWFYGSIYEVSQCRYFGLFLAYDLLCWRQEDSVLGEEGFLNVEIWFYQIFHKKSLPHLVKHKFYVFLFLVNVSYSEFMCVIHTIGLLTPIVSSSGTMCRYVVSWYRLELKI